MLSLTITHTPSYQGRTEGTTNLIFGSTAPFRRSRSHYCFPSPRKISRLRTHPVVSTPLKETLSIPVHSGLFQSDQGILGAHWMAVMGFSSFIKGWERRRDGSGFPGKKLKCDVPYRWIGFIFRPLQGLSSSLYRR